MSASIVRNVPHCCFECARFLDASEARTEHGETYCKPSCAALDAAQCDTVRGPHGSPNEARCKLARNHSGPHQM